MTEDCKRMLREERLRKTAVVGMLQMRLPCLPYRGAAPRGDVGGDAGGHGGMDPGDKLTMDTPRRGTFPPFRAPTALP